MMQNSIEVSATTTKATNQQDNSSSGLVNSTCMKMTTPTGNADAEIEAPKKTKKAKVDDECDVIGDLMGHYGKWQFVMTILLSLFQVPNTFHIFSPTFQVSVCCVVQMRYHIIANS